MKYLFESSVITRALQDSPGGKVFLGGRRAPTIAELKAREAGGDNDNDNATPDSASITKHGRTQETENVI